MAAPLKAAMPPNLDIGGGYTIRFAAVDLSTGNDVSNVTVSAARIYAEVVSGGSGGTGGTAGPFMLVPGPGA